MSEYKSIKGKTVQFLGTDPSETSTEGQVWYNSAAGAFKSVVALEAWSSGSPLGIARTGLGATGTQTAGLAVGGRNPTFAPSFPSTVSNYTEEYNGSGWSNGGSLSTNRYRGAAMGTQTAGLISGAFNTPGSTTNATEEYDGSTWTAGNNSNTSRGYTGGCGNQIAGLMMGGVTYPPNTGRSEVEEYDGTSWTAVNALPQTRLAMANSGIQTAALAIGGGLSATEPNSSPNAWSGTVESYDGTNWTASPSLNTPRRYGSGSGTQTNAYTFSGTTGSPSTFILSTEAYDGTSWSTKPSVSNLSTGTNESGYGVVGSSNATYRAGGFSTTYTGVTEEYNTSINVITGAAWASGGNLNTARQRTGGFGSSQTSAVTAAGATAPPASALSATEEYNGSAWTSSGNVNTARFNMTAFGTEPAGVLSGKGTPSTPYDGTTEEYNGSTWTTVTSYSSPDVNYRSSCGTQTAGLLSGGVRSPSTPAENSNLVEEYNGTSWTSGTNLPQYQAYNNQAGTQTAAINGGGGKSPNGITVSPNTISLEYDGSTWTAGPNANLFSDNLNAFNGGIGTQTSAMFSGGDGTGTVIYDGTSFATSASIAAARGNLSAAGNAPASAGIVYCGSPVPSVGNTTEEFTGETSALNIKTLTTS